MMPLSHLFEDLEAWYGSGGSHTFATYTDRVRAMFQPGFSVAEGTVTANSPVESEARVFQDVQHYQAYGHNGSMQPTNRLQSATTSNYGHVYPAGTAVSNRGDFATLDNPFFYTSNPMVHHYSSQKATGLHFLIFLPTIENFTRTRLAMDGSYPGGKA